MNMIVADRVEERKLEALPEQLLLGSETGDSDSTTITPGRTPSEVMARSTPPLPFEDDDFRPPAPDVADAPPPVRTLDYAWREPLTRRVADWLRVFVGPGQVVELRALNV